MTTKSILIALTVALLGLISIVKGRTQTGNGLLEEAKKEIALSNGIYFSAFEKNDPAIFVARYARDCRIMAPDMRPLNGAEGATAFFRLAYDRIGLRSGKFITTQIYGDGKDYVTEEGVWQSFDARHVLFDNGKYLVLWKRTSDGWKMFRDSFSSDRQRPSPR